MKKILVATTNPGKVAELSAMLGGGVQWVGLDEFPDVPEVVEDGDTFVENARKKALGYARATGLWTIADDSGLVVDALGGEPGVRSSRYSGDKEAGADRGLIDHRNIAKVLELMENVPDSERTARFVCCLCMASPQEVLLETEGTLEGVIGLEELGVGGFGYDPVFLIPDLGKSAAQLAPDEKNAISHRGNAIRKLRPLLDQLLAGA